MVVGTAGHIDHGKSSLIAALTGVHPDRLPEEKRRGITTDLGFGHLEVNGGQIGIVDVPGHERFVRTMIAGAGGMDAVLLVVAADGGVQPQTREHFAICRLLGLRRGVIALTKCDRATPAQRTASIEQVGELIAGSFLAAAPVVEVSAVTGEGLDALRHALAACAPARDPARLLRPFRLPIDRSFSLAGFGTVVTGTLAQGRLESGAELELVGSRRRLRLRGMQVHGRPASLAVAGDRTAANLAGIDAAELRRGDTLAEPGVFFPVRSLLATVDLLPGAKLAARVHLHLLTSERVATVGVLAPGLVHIKLDAPVVAAPGDRFILRQLSPALTVGGGRVLELDPPRQSRAAHATFGSALVAADFTEAVRLHLGRAGAQGMALADLARAFAVSAADLRAGLPPGTLLCQHPSAAALADFAPVHEAELLRSLAQNSQRGFSPADPRRPVAARPAGARTAKGGRAALPAHWLTAAAERLLATGRLVHSPAPPGYAQPGVPDADQVALCGRIEELFRRAGLGAPPAAELLGAQPDPAAARAAVTALARQGRLLAIHPGHYLHAEAAAALHALLAAHKPASPTFSVADFKQWTGLSRKFVIPLLEYLDRGRLTRRRGDRREIA